MSDRIKKIKVKKADGSMTDYIPIGVDAENVDFDNGYKLDQIVGDINPDEDGTLEVQLSRASDIVTPEDYGAKGDGITDDAEAIKAAFESGKKIKFMYKKSYFIGHTITILNPVDVDFNYCTLIFNGTIILDNEENKLSTYNYIGRDKILNDVDCKNGIFRITSSTQKWSESKTQYNLGFSSYVYNNYLSNPFDYDCEGNAYYYPYNYFNFKNIGDIKQYENKDYTLTAFRAKGRVVNGYNINAIEYGSLTLFEFMYSLINIDTVNISSTIRPLVGTYYYGFSICCCSNWKLKNIIGLSDWHIATTGGTLGVSYDGLIKDCTFKMYVNEMISYVEHENTYNTHLENSFFDGIVINNGSIENCRINSRLWLMTNYYEQYKRDIKIINTDYIMDDKYSLLYAEFLTKDYYYGDVVFINSNFYFMKKARSNTFS